ncbi:MAG: MFS transporter, partial [Victivallales bacterium]|nr:MFS transporter [Victivallales bacterium]
PYCQIIDTTPHTQPIVADLFKQTQESGNPPGKDDAEDANSPKTVQEYIDETPFWADGTKLPCISMTRMQWRIWWTATAGKFFEGMIIFMTGVALPLIVMEFDLDAASKGLVSSSSLFGILVGASFLGSLADQLGRKFMFISEMAILVVFLTMVSFAPNIHLLVFALFGVGMALGCDYPTGHMVISENIPSRARGKLVLGAFAFQAVGALAGTAVGYFTLYDNPSISAWRWMYASTIIPATVILVGRFFISDSCHWLVASGKIAKAEKEMSRLLKRDPPYPKTIKIATTGEKTPRHHKGISLKAYLYLFDKNNIRRTVLASVPWFIQDLGTYGIGIFTPTIIAGAIGAEIKDPHNLAALVHNDMLAAKSAALIDVLLIVGIVFAILLTDRIGRIKLQIFGFLGCSCGLFVAGISAFFDGTLQIALVFAGFMLFNFMTNIGPNAQTYLLSGEVFPIGLRGKGAGFAASFAKIGAVVTAFFFPILLVDIGTTALLGILIAAYLTGAAITWLFRIETKGINLENI